jgi:hypothetical protein
MNNSPQESSDWGLAVKSVCYSIGYCFGQEDCNVNTFR